MEPADAAGSAAAVQCGTHIRFEVRLLERTGPLSYADFRTNGCGFMIAAADALTEIIRGQRVSELHALDPTKLRTAVEARLGIFPAGRAHCLRVSIEALRAAFADLRQRRIEEFTGEKALICTCFSVTEDVVEDLITGQGIGTVREVGDACNAGTGCGSCQPIIQDMIDVLSGGRG